MSYVCIYETVARDAKLLLFTSLIIWSLSWLIMRAKWYANFCIPKCQSLLIPVLDYDSLLDRYGVFIAKHFADSRVVNIGKSHFVCIYKLNKVCPYPWRESISITICSSILEKDYFSKDLEILFAVRVNLKWSLCHVAFSYSYSFSLNVVYQPCCKHSLLMF